MWLLATTCRPRPTAAAAGPPPLARLCNKATMHLAARPSTPKCRPGSCTLPLRWPHSSTCFTVSCRHAPSCHDCCCTCLLQRHLRVQQYQLTALQKAPTPQAFQKLAHRRLWLARQVKLQHRGASLLHKRHAAVWPPRGQQQQQQAQLHRLLSRVWQLGSCQAVGELHRASQQQQQHLLVGQLSPRCVWGSQLLQTAFYVRMSAFEDDAACVCVPRASGPFAAAGFFRACSAVVDH